MERLTKKDYFTWDADDTIKLTYIEKLQNKLGKFEDFMEEMGFESLEDLKKYINLSFELSLIPSKKRQEIKALKDRWEKLKEWAKEEQDWEMGKTCFQKMQELEQE